MFQARVATRSPSSTPRPFNALASFRPRSATSAKVALVEPSPVQVWTVEPWCTLAPWSNRSAICRWPCIIVEGKTSGGSSCAPRAAEVSVTVIRKGSKQR